MSDAAAGLLLAARRAQVQSLGASGQEVRQPAVRAVPGTEEGKVTT